MHTLSPPSVPIRWLTWVAVFMLGVGLNASISAAQAGFSLLLLLSMYRLWGSGAADFRVGFIDAFRTFAIPVGLWCLLRMFHIFASSDHMEEAIQAREVWLILMVPVIALVLLEKENYSLFFWSLLITSAAGGLFGFCKVLLTDWNPAVERLGGFDHTHHLTFSGTMSLTILCGWYFFMQKWREGARRSGILILILLLLSTCGFLFAQSRGGFVSIFLVILIYSIFRMRLLVVLVLPLLLATPAWLLRSSSTVQRLVDEIGSVENRSQYRWSTFGIRLDLWRAGLKMYGDYPLLGTGDHDYGVLYQKYKISGAVMEADTGSHQHNDYLNTLVLYGTLGLTVWMMFFLLPLRELSRLIRGDYRKPEFFLMLGVILFMIMSLTQCYFTDEEVQMMYWALIALIYREKILSRNADADS